MPARMVQLKVAKDKSIQFEDLVTCLQKAYRSTTTIRIVGLNHQRKDYEEFFYVDLDELDEYDRKQIFKSLHSGRLHVEDIDRVLVDLCNKGLLEPGEYTVVYRVPKPVKKQRR